VIGPVWERSHSVDVGVDVSRAWAFMTDISNWADPPAEFSLDGPFVAGSIGATRMPDQPLIRWRLERVEPGRSYLIELPLDRATLAFEWSFEALSERSTRVTQRIRLGGEDAAAHGPQVEAAFGANLPAGMHRVARMMEAVLSAEGPENMSS
jgi:hypothetical protein